MDTVTATSNTRQPRHADDRIAVGSATYTGRHRDMTDLLARRRRYTAAREAGASPVEAMAAALLHIERGQ